MTIIMCDCHLFLCVPSDDRFILKQMPKLEVQSFLEFAPHYFVYITGAVQQKVGIDGEKNSDFWA